MQNINWLEWMGYIASGIILISLLMRSVKKLRWINTIGSVVFAVYGFMIGSVPVAVMNIGIVAINIFYLAQMMREKEYFQILDAGADLQYLKSFVKFYESEIKKFGSFDESRIENSAVRFFVLRNMTVAGVFICSEADEETLKIELDFATPSYRDFKIGRYIFHHQKSFFLQKGFTKFIAESQNPTHIAYLRKMGFEPDEKNVDFWVKNLL